MRYLKTSVIVFACALAGLSGCDDNDYYRGPPSYTTSIISDSAYDGDIQQTGPTTYAVTQGMSPTVQSVFAGVDPTTVTEYRTFLDFPLGGAGGVPGNANIQSAFLDIYINSLQPTTVSLPILIELVTFEPPTLIGTDFDRTAQPALASLHIQPNFTQSDVGANTSIDVTPLLQQAQNLGLVDFQLRISEDLSPVVPGLLQIDDSTGTDRANVAPQLVVTYF